MQHRRECRNSEAINGISQKCNDLEYSCTENSDSSGEYEEDTHISYQFRRWANHIWSVSNNVTSRLRDLLRKNPSSTSATSDHSEESFLNESDITSCTSSNTAIETWDRINYGGTNQRQYYQQPKNHCPTPEEHHNRYSQKYYPVTEDRRIHHVSDNRTKNSPALIMGHKVATYPPVLILPRVHQQSTGVYHSRHQTLRCHNAHRDQYADGWYQQYGKHWSYGGSRYAGYNFSALSGRRETPEKLSTSTGDPKVKRSGGDSTKIEPNNHGIRSVKHYSNHVRDFCSENYSNRYESVSPNHATRPSKEESLPKSCRQKDYGDIEAPRNSSHCLKNKIHSSQKKVVWDLQFSDNASREPTSINLPRADHPAKSYRASDNGEERDYVENVEIPVKDNEKPQETAAVIFPDQNPNAVQASEISHDTQPQPSCNLDVSDKKNNKEKNDNLANSNSSKWSSKNGVDSLLQNLRERMRTLTNVHPFDINTRSGPMECGRKEEANLANKECIVASCLANAYLPQHSENRNDIVTTNEEGRPSFTERIQDIWQNGSETWKSAPDHKTSTSSYDLHSCKNVSSKLSLFGLNGQPVLREYFGEHNSAVTLARILEKLIDSKTKSDSTAQKVISEAPKPPPRSSRKQSNTGLRVNVGVQKSVRTSTTACQGPAACSRHYSIERRRSRRRFRRTFESHASELPIQTSKPLQVFSGRSIIPISSIQSTTPIMHPIPNLSRFSPPSQDTGYSLNYYDDPMARHRDLLIVDTPPIEESHRPQNNGPSSSTKGSIGVNNERQTSNVQELNRRLINEQGQFFSFVYEKIEQERHYAKSVAADTDANQQHNVHQFTRPVQLEEQEVVDNTGDPALKGVSAKPRSWWTKKFTFNKSGAFKDKMSSLLKYVTKKPTGVDCQTQKLYFDEAVIETVIPTPPIRVRRKSTVGAIKCSRSIQWDLDTSVSQYTETIDEVHGNENQKLNKSTSVTPITERVTGASGTNTIEKKPRKTSPILFLIQKKEASVGPEIIQYSKETCTDTSSESPAICDPVESGVVANGEEKLALLPTTDNKPSFQDLSQSAKDHIQPSNDPVQKEVKNSTKESKFKVSRSLSSKIPLATKPASPFNASSRICGKRPSTAPMLDNSPSTPSPLNETTRVLECEKTFGKESTSPHTAKKMPFKHNRSSLLRANNSMSRKSATGQSNTWINTTWNKNMERKLIFKDLTSPVRIVEEKSSPDLSPTEVTACEKSISKKEFDEDESNSLPQTSERETKGKHSKNSPGEEASNFELCKSGETSKDEAASFDMRPCSSRASKVEEDSTMNKQAQELLDDHKSMMRNSVNFLEETASCKIYPRLPNEEDEANRGNDGPLPTQVNKTNQLTHFKESRGSNTNVHDSDNVSQLHIESDNVSELHIEKESFPTKNPLFQGQSEGAFTYRVDRMRTTFNERTIELRPQLAHSPARKTAKYLPECSDVQTKESVMRDKEISTLTQSERSRLPTKLIPCSGLLIPQCNMGKNTMAPCKEIVPLAPTITGLDPPNNESNVSLLKLFYPTDHPQHPKAGVLEPEQLDSVPMKRTVEATSGDSEDAKNKREKMIKEKKVRPRKTDVILGMARKVLNEAIDKAVTVNRQTNSGIVSSSENIHQCISTNSGKSSDFSADSLEAIRVGKTLNNTSKKLEVTENVNKVMAAKLFETDHYITQSIITFDLAEIADRPEKLRPSIFNVRLERNVEIARSKPVDGRKDEFRHEKISDTGSELKVMNDENNCKNSQGGRNVKIDNKVLVQKVKSSIENGVPLKTITITDPAILQHSNLIPKDKILLVDRNFKKSKSKVKETPSKKLFNISPDVPPDARSDEECSYTTWASHESREIGIEDRLVPEISTKSNNVELHASENHNNLASNMPSLKLANKPARFRGTLIPRYKKCPSILVSENRCSEEMPKRKYQELKNVQK